MKNHWLKLHRVHEFEKRFHWMFMVGRNAVFSLLPRTVHVETRPAPECQPDERVTIVFPYKNDDTELFTWLADYYLGCQQSGKYAYLRLVDEIDQPYETWSFDQIKIDGIRFTEEDIEVSITFKSKEYRDFLRKIELYTSKSV